MKIVIAVATLWICACAFAAELHPIVEVDFGYFFGATSDGKWIKAAEAAKSIKEGTVYRVYGLTKELGEAKGTKPAAMEDVCPDNLSMALEPKIEKGAIALAAPWNALPRKPLVADPTQEVYVNAVRDFLKDRGIKDPKVKIKKILRIDLDGDGEEEVLISATNYLQAEEEEMPIGSPPGSYSIVLLRRVIAGKVKTQLIAGETHADQKHLNAPNYYDVLAILDLNGDGKLEIVVHSAYYEGGATMIYECQRDKIVKVLSVACGV